MRHGMDENPGPIEANHLIPARALKRRPLLPAILACLSIIIACQDADNETNVRPTLKQMPLASVSRQVENREGLPAVSIFFGDRSQGLYHLTILKKDLVEGRRIENRGMQRQQRVWLRGEVNGRSYVESLKEGTFIDFNLEEMNNDASRAVFTIDACLVDSDSFIRKQRIRGRVVVSGEAFTNLVRTR